jgi:pilus assembly protein Flp/PilA
MTRFIRSLLQDKKGVAALEYSILAGLMVLGIVAAISNTNIKSSMKDIFTNVNTELVAAKTK